MSDVFCVALLDLDGKERECGRLVDAEERMSRLKQELAKRNGPPGEWRCPECGFALHSRAINARTGDVGVPRVQEVPVCANGCGTMASLTWKELCESYGKTIDRLEAHTPARLEKALQAIGLATTVVPGMEMDADDPIGMMRKVVAECETFRAKAEILDKPFPIQDGPSVPWSVMLPHEARCQATHGQSLKRIAERGGLGAAEAFCVVNNLKWRDAEEDGVEETERRWGEFASGVSQLRAERDALKRERSDAVAERERLLEALRLDDVQKALRKVFLEYPQPAQRTLAREVFIRTALPVPDAHTASDPEEAPHDGSTESERALDVSEEEKSHVER